MKLIIATKSMLFAFVLMFSGTLFPQTAPVFPIENPNNITWSVAGTGCPAPSALPTTLTTQWTAATTAVGGNATELAIVAAEQAYAVAQISSYFSQNPQQMIMVRIQHTVIYVGTTGTNTPKIQTQTSITPVKTPTGATCPTS